MDCPVHTSIWVIKSCSFLNGWFFLLVDQHVNLNFAFKVKEEHSTLGHFNKQDKKVMVFLCHTTIQVFPSLIFVDSSSPTYVVKALAFFKQHVSWQNNPVRYSKFKLSVVQKKKLCFEGNKLLVKLLAYLCWINVLVVLNLILID